MQFPTFPLRKQAYPACAVKWPKERTDCADAPLCQTGRPFFHIVTDNSIATLFLAAVAANADEAMAFVSKHCIGVIDLDALRDVLGQTNRVCESWVRAPYANDPKNCQTQSVLVVDPERNVNRLLHLHMIREPDRYGQWKIYGVEQE